MVFLINLAVENKFDTRKLQSLGIAYLAAELKNNGIEFYIHDACGVHKNIPVEELKMKILAERPTHIGFYTLEHNMLQVLNLIKQVKQFYSPIVFLGGPQATVLGKEILYNSPTIDIILAGEAEKTICKMIQGDYDLPGIIYRDSKGKIIENPNYNLNTSLDELIFPLREYGGQCLLTTSIDNGERIYTAPVSSSRGCPFNCSFCSVPILASGYSKRWRYRSPENIAEEIAELKEKYNNVSVAFIDDNFLVDPDRTKKIASLIAKIGSIRFSVSARVDTIIKQDVSYFQYLHNCGLWAVEVGVENFSNDVLSKYNKGHSETDALYALHLLQKSGVKAGIDFIMFNPWSTLTELKHNSKIIQDNKFDINNSSAGDNLLYNRLYPYPGTAYYGKIDMNNYFESEMVSKVYNELWRFREDTFEQLNSIQQTDNIMLKYLSVKLPYKVFDFLLEDPERSYEDCKQYTQFVAMLNSKNDVSCSMTHEGAI